MSMKLQKSPVSKQWHAVTIVTKGSSCEAARAARNTRYLSAQAPRLPLIDCSKPDACPCAYKHHADRRSEARRADDEGGIARSTGATPERRQRADRRKID
jgi:hypothetical protein